MLYVVIVQYKPCNTMYFLLILHLYEFLNVLLQNEAIKVSG